MKARLPDEVMPTLYLTRDEELQVEREASEMVRDTFDAFNAFIDSGRAFSKTHWKKVREKEGFRVYRTRKSYASVLAHTRGSSSSSGGRSSHSGIAHSDSISSSSSSHNSSCDASSTNADAASMNSSGSDAARSVPMLDTMQQFPAIVLTGVIPGTMEDAGFGSVADSDEMWRLRGSYINDGNRDCKILATLKHATAENPFEFFGIKWAWRQLPALLQQRDMVYAEKINVVRDASGKSTAGYNLMHSIHLPGVPELTQYDILRLKLSVCFLTRPYDDRSIEIYCRAFNIPVGDVPTTISISLYADALLSTLNIMECSHMKKLMWLMRQRQRSRDAAGQRLRRDTESALVAGVTHCQGCERTLKRFSGLNRSVAVCRCCQRVVCSKCSSDRKIVLDVADDGRVTQEALPFCVQCVMEARALPALDIARTTAVDWIDN